MKIKRYFTLLTILILALVVINTMGWSLYADQTARYYDLINIAGKQRMLTQRISYFAARRDLSQKDLVQLKEALSLIKTNHLKFTQGASEFNLVKPQPGEELHQLYFGDERLDQGIHQLIKAVQNYIDTKGIKEPFQMSLAMPDQMLKKTNHAVELYIEKAKDKTQQTSNWLIMFDFILLVGILVLFSLIYKAIFQTPDTLIANAIAPEPENNDANVTNDLTDQALKGQPDNSFEENLKTEAHSSNQHEDIKEEYQTDIPHTLECKRLLFVDGDKENFGQLIAELNQIVGIDLAFCSNIEKTLPHLQMAESHHRPVDILFSISESNFEHLQKTINSKHLKQDYCHLLLCEGEQPNLKTYIPLNEKTVEHITEAYQAYEQSATNKEHDFKEKQVLLVDDNTINLMVLEGMVQKNAVKCVLAKDGKEALELAKTQKFDLIFMDLQMPVMNGYEATERILQETENKETPIIAVTANHDYDGRRRCVEIGMVDCEAKPVHHTTVERILHKYLS